jgi:hypothetical protein
MDHTSFQKVIAAVLLFLTPITPAKSATIERYSDPVMGCTMLLSGEIVPGDAERLSALYWESQGTNTVYPTGAPRLCLNSPGGNFLEGVRLARAIQNLNLFGTAIADGHICESACAIAFMAGGYTEGGYDIVAPILHPRGRLGFHSPGLEIPIGQYSEEEVSRAYRIALQAISEIVQLRAENYISAGGYRFPENLLFNMIATPPDAMYYVDTVGKAIDYGIDIFPSALNASDPAQAAYHVCYANYRGANSMTEEPTMRRLVDGRILAGFTRGFGVEAAEPCRVLFQPTFVPPQAMNMYNQLLTTPSGPIPEDEYTSSSIPAVGYTSFPPETQLASLPLDVEQAWREFSARIEATPPPVQQCWLTRSGNTARIVNVNEYVNLRRQPDFSAPVIREVPLGEQVRVSRPDNLTVIADQSTYDACVRACQAFGRNPDDRQAADQAQQCIADNLLWYEMTDALGNRGWVSRRFLEEVE